MKPSQTAQYVALYRALETEEMRREPLFRDPLARAFIPKRLRLVLRLARARPLRVLAERYADRRAPGARTSAICRTRFIDDVVRREASAGIHQLVLLGAGFDCRAHRLPELQNTRVFEVDRRQTQAVKRAAIARQSQALRDVTYIEVDFHHDDLRTKLVEGGWNASERTTFVWEGVTAYLSQQAVENVLAFLGSTAQGSVLLFTYIHKGVLDGSVHFPGAQKAVDYVRRIGEPWTFGLAPAEVPAFVARFGFELEQDMGADEYRARYGWSAALNGYGFYRIAVTRVR